MGSVPATSPSCTPSSLQLLSAQLTPCPRSCPTCTRRLQLSPTFTRRLRLSLMFISSQRSAPLLLVLSGPTLLLLSNLLPLFSSSNSFPNSNLFPSSNLLPSSLLSHNLPQHNRLPQHGLEDATTTLGLEFPADRSSKDGVRW